MTPKAAKRTRPRNRRPGRGGTKALAIIIAVLALTGAGLALVACFSDDIARSMAEDVGHTAEGSLASRYRNMVATQSPRRVAEILVNDTFKRVDFEPFIERSPWKTLRVSMAIRLVFYFLVLIGAGLALASKNLGPRIIVFSSLCLVLQGAVEALVIYVEGQHIAAEFVRDMIISCSGLIEEAGMEDQLVNPMKNFPRREVETLRLIDGIYFVVMTVFWQLAALCMASCRPFESKLSPAEQKAVTA